jgi:hypothetical protein
VDLRDAKKRVLAAQTLLLEPSSSFEKFSAVKDILKGVHPHLDEALERCEKDLATVEKVLGHDFISLGLENLPEITEEQKERKRAILFFWKTWNTLRSEVARVQAEMNESNYSSDQVAKSSHLGKIFNFAKGPFGILTIIAIVLVSASAYTSVQIVIHNQGCATMIPSSSVPNFIPGISFPTKPIASGETALASLPGLPITIDGKTKGTLVASLLTLHMTFQLGTVSSVTLDGTELLGKTTSLNLGSKKTHDIVFTCK